MEKKRDTQNVLNPDAIPIEGALGLLALGSAGLRAWRNVRDAAVAAQGTVSDNTSDGDLTPEDRTKQSEKGGAE